MSKDKDNCTGPFYDGRTYRSVIPLDYCMTTDKAQPLFKKYPSDAGYDLTLVARSTILSPTATSNSSSNSSSNSFGKGFFFGEPCDELFKPITFRTDIIVQPPHGYHLEMVARSSLCDRGYILANSIGIIDNAYRGAILVKLIKFDKDKPDLQLPGKYVQLIPRKSELLTTRVVDAKDLIETDRGDGGFGSTGV